ncbi:MAG: spore germination protein [Oscillospiraceae bacterium]|jgi:spore germination protein KA|nr:spore germination protein [Oscillospiraceae bacterium]
MNDNNRASETEFSEKLADNTAALKQIMARSHDFVLREFTSPAISGGAAVAFIDGLVKQEMITQNAVMPLVLCAEGSRPAASLDEIRGAYLVSSDAAIETDFGAALNRMLHGDVMLLADGFAGAIIMNARGWDKRSVSEPQTETVVRGPREGFTETLRTNTSLLRRRIAAPEFKIELTQVGRRSKTNVAVAYVDGVVAQGIVDEVMARLSAIDVDIVNGNGTIEDFLKDQPYSVFETINYSEKPDVIAAQIMEGRVAIITDGTPFVLTVPMLFMENFATPEDYLVGTAYATFLRLIRFLSFALTLLAPSLFVAVITFHQELLPVQLLFTVAASAEGLPFPAVVEMAVMLLIFEILKEAGIRLPKPIGQAVSIVGALVMGQAAIAAGIVGAPVVIIVALTGVCGFSVPNLSNACTLLRWVLFFLGGFFGLYGMVIGVICLLVYVASLRSFGVMFASPIAPFVGKDMRDMLFLAPSWKLNERPVSIGSPDRKRVGLRKLWYR